MALIPSFIEGAWPVFLVSLRISSTSFSIDFIPCPSKFLWFSLQLRQRECISSWKVQGFCRARSSTASLTITRPRPLPSAMSFPSCTLHWQESRSRPRVKESSGWVKRNSLLFFSSLRSSSFLALWSFSFRTLLRLVLPASVRESVRNQVKYITKMSSSGGQILIQVHESKALLRIARK